MLPHRPERRSGERSGCIGTDLLRCTNPFAGNQANGGVQPIKYRGRKRIFLRGELTRSNLLLADAAKTAGIIEPIDYAIFQNHGYMGLYGGLDAKAIREKKSQNLPDYMGSWL